MDARSGSSTAVTVRVLGAESVTVPAGSFETWHVELDLSGVRRDVWYGQEAPGPLVRSRSRSGRGSERRMRSFRASQDAAVMGDPQPPPSASTPPKKKVAFLLVSLLFQIPLMIGLPLWLGLRLRRKLDIPMKVWAIGALAFVVSQVVHLPLNWAVHTCRRILRRLSEGKGSGSADVAEALGIATAEASKHLRDLVDAKLVRKAGVGRGTRYFAR